MAIGNTISIKVDNDFARFGSKSYAINKINTVEVRERHPYDRALAAIFGVVALISAVGAIGVISEGNLSNGIVSLVICLGSAYGAYWAWQRSNIIEYQLFLMTSSSSMQAYTSRDEYEVMNLRDSIEAAMVRSAQPNQR
jgi:hypothetical protein